MKKTFLIICLFCFSKAFAQPGDRSVAEMEMIKPIFINIFDTSFFNVLVGPNTITAFYKDSVLPIGLMSTPSVEDSFYINNSFFNDLWTSYTIDIRFAPRITETEINKIKFHNDSLEQLKNALPEKLKMTKIKYLKATYYPNSKTQTKKVLQYEKEVKELYDQMIPLPRFYTEFYSVYINDDMVYIGPHQHPEWNGYYLVPDEANLWRWKIWEKINNIEEMIGIYK